MRNSDWSSDVCSSDLEARVVRARADITAIVTALNMYRLDNFDYPSTDQGLEALVKQPSGVPNWRSDGYLPAIPKDPWGREYLYLKPGAHGAFDVGRSEEQTSELQSLMRNSYAVVCLTKKTETT